MSEDGDLPSGWTLAPLRDVTTINPTNPAAVPVDGATVSFVPMAAVEELSGRMNAKTTRSWSEVKKGFTRFQDGDVVFAKITPSMENGKVALATNLFNGVAAGTTELHVVRPLTGVSGRYLLHYLLQETFRRRARARMTGTAGQLRVPTQFLEEEALPLPPAREQQRIVEAIDSYLTRIDDAVANLERVQAKLNAYRASVLKAAVEGRLVPTEASLAGAEKRAYESAEVLLARMLDERRRHWEEAELAKLKAAGRTPKDDRWKAKYDEPVAPDRSELRVVPHGWCWASIDQLSQCLDHLRVPVSKRERQKRNGTVPYYGANGQAGWIDTPIFDESLVLVVEDETFTGRTKPFSYLIEGPSWVNNHAHVLRALGAISPRFLNAALAHYPFIPLTKGTTGRRKLTKKALMAAAVPIPPLEEQVRIMEIVDELVSFSDSWSVTVASQRAHSQRLRQAVLKWAFEGTLVDQDPTDEPADRLLSRTRAERAAAVATKRSRGRVAKGAA